MVDRADYNIVIAGKKGKTTDWPRFVDTYPSNSEFFD